MNVPPLIPSADRDQLFADWGIPASLEQVSEVYDPSSGLRAEEIQTTTLTVVQGGGSQTPSTATAAGLLESQFTFLVRTSEFPQGNSWSTYRLTTLGQTFRIISTSVSPDGGATLLTCTQLPAEG